ncbi:hypothetical protein PR048_032953 [Dryococelus australis]|uniref:E3 ubiquitin-protein transferase MAEA n=1 Tax=Dryococelus australis TaxID=614101 RepID=A0ABQ9G7U4_9NEOP|nr:hypothetical protein PR048_032953 [Dryococelus australis]
MGDVKNLEHPTLKVPYELLNKKFRAAQKQLDREVSHVQAAALELERGLHGDLVQAGDISKLLGGMVERLQVLKRKCSVVMQKETVQADESISEELEAANVCKRRLEHLKEHAGGKSTNGSAGSINLWRRRRLDRMLVEYFLRRGYYGTATRLAHRSDLRDLTNIDVFLVSREVECSLARRETAKCLAWCHDNRSKLRKLKSTMEFNLRIQEFVELVRADRRMDAVRHARKYFSSFEEEQLQDVQHCMALLAFPVNTEYCDSHVVGIQCRGQRNFMGNITTFYEVQLAVFFFNVRYRIVEWRKMYRMQHGATTHQELLPYKELLDEKRWELLVEQFRQENYRLYQLASQSVFTVALQAGLSALKTPYPLKLLSTTIYSLLACTQCYSANRENHNASCPVCQESLNQLAATLPFAHCSQSRLVCAMSSMPLNEHNQPMMLPNGYVYGEKVRPHLFSPFGLLFDSNKLSLWKSTKTEYSFIEQMKLYLNIFYNL